MNLKFDANGLIPAIVIDNNSGKVLTLAYMNEESFNKTLTDKTTWFYSRSRQCLWHKGETSGNFQHVVKIVADCDSDALAVYVNKDGPACHLGTDSCFENEILYAPEDDKSFCMNDLAALIADRRANPKEGSYTNYLFDKGLDKILKKVGEECTEVIIGAKGGDKAETVYEICDLTYHVMVLMVEYGMSLNEIRDELARRHIVDKKVKQEKMQ